MNLSELIGNLNGKLKSLQCEIRDGKDVSVFGMDFSERTVASLAAFDSFVYVASDFSIARDAYEQFKSVEPKTVYVPETTDMLSFRRISGGAARGERLSGEYAAASGEANIIVTTAAALTQLYPRREDLVSRAVTIEKDKDYDLDEVCARLVRGGYVRADFAESEGQYARRGDVLDIWPLGYESGVRVEFFGDTVESVRTVTEDMISGEELGFVRVLPSSEFALSKADAEKVMSELSALKPPEDGQERFYSIKSALELELSAALGGGVSAASCLDFVAPLIPHESFFGFFKPKLVIYDDAKKVYDAVTAAITEHANRFVQLLEKGEVMRFSADGVISGDEVFKTDARQIAFHLITSRNRIFTPTAVASFESAPMPDYYKDRVALVDDIRVWRGNYRVVLCCGDADGVRSIGEFLSDNGVTYGTAPQSDVRLIEGGVKYGAVLHDQKTALIGSKNLFGVKGGKSKRRIRSRGREAFTLPEVGDYVVHEVHGIGLCEKIERMEMAGAVRDYIVIGYAAGDKLYLPVENMDCLSKFVAPTPPKLSRIGGAEFAKAMEKARSSAKALAFDLLEVFRSRSAAKGKVYSDDDVLLNEFIDDFPHSETDDQLRATEEALADLKAGRIMDRLLCGDVGYGKTEVALRLAFKVISEGGQVAFVAPTTILASQHYETVKARMEKFGVRVRRLTRFDSTSDTRKTLKALENGSADIVCGTHRVLGKDVKFKSLELLVLDEEQRFGVADKEKIKLARASVNVLSMSATPIPRTLHMSLAGIRDVSVLDTPPDGRIPVETFVTEFTETLVFDAVTRELGRNGQVFIVYNRVSGIDAFAAKVSAIVPAAKITVAHGQMDEARLEYAIETFVSGETDILISSTIVENGIDMPRANTMIVVDSDRLGLSQLYQLRGRVGRSNRLAYVYFTFDGGRTLTESAYKRLEAITKYTGFGSGFKLAMADLEIRGAGSIFGREQHGHMEKVGYDTYVRLLGEEVASLKGEAAPRRRADVRVLTDYDAYIPEGLIGDEEWRLKLYSDVSRVSSVSERAALLADVKDMCGFVPDQAANLLTVALVKNLASKVGASKAILKKGETALIFDRIKDAPESLLTAATKLSGVKVSFANGRIDFVSGAVMINFLSQAI